MKLFNVALIVVVGMFFSSTTISASEPDSDFQLEKNREIGNVKERLQIIEGRLNCMQKTSDFESLKTCNQAADKKMDALEAKINSQERNKKQADTKTKQPNNKQSDKAHPANKHPDTKNKPN